MAFEDDAPLERTYPYRTGWKALSCLSLCFGVTSAGGVALVPICCDQWRNGGNLVFGALALVGAPCTLVAILFAVAAFIVAVRDAVRPPLVRVTLTALQLPDEVRGQALEKDEQGNPKMDGPRQHPEELPFKAIRWVRRETGSTPGNDKLVIVHELSPVTLELQQSMMLPADFDELETVLRRAVPEAFTALPVPQTPPSPDAQ